MGRLGNVWKWVVYLVEAMGHWWVGKGSCHFISEGLKCKLFCRSQDFTRSTIPLPKCQHYPIEKLGELSYQNFLLRYTLLVPVVTVMGNFLLFYYNFGSLARTVTLSSCQSFSSSLSCTGKAEFRKFNN